MVFLLLTVTAYSQDPIAIILDDPAISWAAVSEINIDLEAETVYSEQFIQGDFNWVSTIKVDLVRFPDFPAEKFLSHLLVEQLGNKQLTMYSLETNEPLDFQALRKELVYHLSAFSPAGEEIERYQYQVPIEGLFDYVVLKQLWFYNSESNTFFNKILGLIPVHIDTESEQTESIHKKLGWIPFSENEVNHFYINNPDLLWVKKTTTYSLFADWEILKGDTEQFVQTYFFELPLQGVLNIGIPGPDIPKQPALSDSYLEETRNGSVCVIYRISKTKEDVALELNEATPELINEIIGLTFDQFLFIDSQTFQMGSYLDLVGPLRPYYYDMGSSDPNDYQDAFYAPIFYFLNPGH